MSFRAVTRWDHAWMRLLLQCILVALVAGQEGDRPPTPREIFFSTPPAILVRTLVSRSDATRWSIYQQFTLEVTGERLKGGLAGGRPLIVDGETCDASMSVTAALEGFLPSDAFSAPDMASDYLAEVWRFPNLRLTLGGIFSACWCRPEGQQRPGEESLGVTGRLCELATGGPLHVVGPVELLGADGVPEQDPQSSSAPYVLDRFLLDVRGYSLEVDFDRIRVVDEDVMCGGPGSATSSQAFLGPGVGVTAASVKPGIQVVASLGQPSTVGQLELKDEQGYHPELRGPLGAGLDPTGENASLVWSDLATTTAGMYRVCWCSALRPTNAGQNDVDMTDLFPFPPGEVNITNDTNDSNFSWDYEFSWEDYGPAFAAFRRLQASYEAAGENGSNESENDSNFSNDTMLFDDWMAENVSAGAVICNSDAMFDLDLGNFSIAGPTRLEVTGAEGFDRRMVRVGVNFSLTVLGFGLGDGQSQRLRLVLAPLRCGQEGTFNGTEHLRGQLAEDPNAAGSGGDPNTAQTWGPLALSRSGLYYVCLCSGRGRSCGRDIDFQVEIGSVQAFWPDLRLQASGGFELRVLPHVVFSVDLVGPELSVEDRVRVVDFSTQCGHPGSEQHTSELRGPLAEAPNTPGILGSTDGNPMLTWPELRVVSGGIFRICWCPGNEQGAAEKSECESAEDFYAEFGTFSALHIRDGWSSACPRAEEPILLHVAAIGLRPELDRVLLLQASEVCGEGTPEVLAPGGVVAAESGFGALQCREDPNAGAELLERKMVCGGTDSLGAVRTFSLGTYRICVCGSLPKYDCSQPSHYWTPAGDPFQVLMGSDAPGAAPSVPPLSLLTAQSTALAAAYAPQPLGSQRRVAAGYEDGVVRVWRPAAPAVSELVGHLDHVQDVAWSPDGAWLASAGLDGSLRIWQDAAGLGHWGTGAPPHPCPHWAPVWARPGGNMPDFDWQNVILGHLLLMNPLNITEEPFVHYAEALSSTDLADIGHLTLHRAAQQCEKACGNFREMAVQFCECGPSLECHILGTCLPKCGLEAHIWPRAHQQGLTAVTVSPDGSVLATASFDTHVKIWDARTLSPDPLATVSLHTRAVLSLASAAVGSHGPILATGGDDDLIAWFILEQVVSAGQASSAAPLRSFREETALGKNVAILAVAFSLDGLWFAAAGRGGMGALWNAETAVKVRTFQPALESESRAHSAAMAGLSFSQDGQWLAIRGAAVKMLPLSNVHLAPPSPEWVPFTGEDLGRCVLSWSSTPGPAGNQPQHAVKLYSNGTVLEMAFAPCNVTDGCATSLPSIRVDARVPFDFVAVRGYFLEYSLSADDLADDCRGGARQTHWDEPNPARSYFTQLGFGMSAEGVDCERVGPDGDRGRASVEACKEACRENYFCNLINYRESARNCDLRYCLNASSPELGSNPDVDVHALIESDDTDELLDATHDGYVMFGAPNSTGDGGIAYGGCQAGREVPQSGVWITIPETPVSRTSTLRWQVAQSRNSEIMAIGEVFLELLVPIDEEHTIVEPSASKAVSVAPDRLEIVASSAAYGGALAVWDARGFDIPSGRHEEYKLKSVFSFTIRAPFLQDADRMRIVESDDVAVCGDAYSSVATLKVQGPTLGQRDFGDSSSSTWQGYAAMQPGAYRACFCGGLGECCNVDGAYATELLSFVVAGASNDHYALCEVSLVNWPLSEVKICSIEGFRGVGTQSGDMIMLQTSGFCGTATGPVASACALRLRCAAKPPAAKKLCRWLERRPMPGVWLAQQRGHDKPEPRCSGLRWSPPRRHLVSFREGEPAG
ncbi:unnamed protein product [Effrenium voratum]|uniref:Uncharacterized protein n=1 Tax=Effrenium voratum TaxID=2562239 RepID=A0AA36MW04_9DINO|nr:unnamed protein product [Effrenium voratum]